MLKIKKIKPMFNYILVTKDVYTDKDVDTDIFYRQLEGSIKEYQKVLAVGDMVRNIKEGDLVKINPERYAQHKHPAGSLKDGVIEDNPVVAYKFKIVELEDKQCLLLTEQDIEFIVEDFTEEAPKIIQVPEKKILI